ncbi:hypothetical protein CAPTEDRAFT_186578 [Capitella teleta]|uniref:Uncharacterized protein n=1 Tax=Capitella teleta TaxID=283909 RepID=R7U4K6_CAPTE|nr:hypothetical protein CAPTEDRAFT_186578 [Capitella teleta]|eukprot:ELU01031.1 hypothetical protein CAPTEDRAFT_186578 [Capitella teleta]
MYNTQTFRQNAAQKLDFRAGMMVIIVFCILTIISYFNELAKAGLLSGNAIRFLRDTETSPRDSIIVQKDGSLHQLDLNLEPLRNLLNKTFEDGKEKDQEIKIAVHLGKNNSYNSNNSAISIYKYEKVVANFYLELNQTICKRLPSANSSSVSVDGLISIVKRLQLELNDRVKQQHLSTVVLQYQHSLGGYWARDCFISEALRRSLITSDVPLNSLYRTEWEQLPRSKKAGYQFLYGPLSFGVCENLEHDCTYMSLIDHPLDKALQTYYLCGLNSSLPLCAVTKVTETDTTAAEFIIRQGSIFFQKLLYQSRHCKLVGRDEVCIHDTQTFFLLSHKDKLAYLADILSNLEKWFSVVGLVDHYQDSMSLFNFALGWNLTACAAMRSDIPKFSTGAYIDGIPYNEMRENLLNNSQVLKSLGYDLAIYAKLEDIFMRQMKVFDLLSTLSMKAEHEPPQIILQKAKVSDRVRKKVSNLYKSIKQSERTDKYLKLYDAL